MITWLIPAAWLIFQLAKSKKTSPSEPVELFGKTIDD